MQNLLKVWNAGITVVMGTDAGNIGTVPGELRLPGRARISSR